MPTLTGDSVGQWVPTSKPQKGNGNAWLPVVDRLTEGKGREAIRWFKMETQVNNIKYFRKHITIINRLIGV